MLQNVIKIKKEKCEHEYGSISQMHFHFTKDKISLHCYIIIFTNNCLTKLTKASNECRGGNPCGKGYQALFDCWERNGLRKISKEWEQRLGILRIDTKCIEIPFHKSSLSFSQGKKTSLAFIHVSILNCTINTIHSYFMHILRYRATHITYMYIYSEFPIGNIMENAVEFYVGRLVNCRKGYSRVSLNFIFGVRLRKAAILLIQTYMYS